MNIFKFPLYFAIFIALIAAGCFSQSPSNVKKDNGQIVAGTIVVMVVDNKTADSKTSVLLRNRIINELFFKGYAKISPENIDKKLEPLYSNKTKGGNGIVAPQVLKELVGADAVMYCSLTESKRSVSLFYATVSVAVRCELRSAQTGEVIWSSDYKSKGRNYGVTGYRLEIKSRAAFEEVMDEVVTKVMETLPDGPKLQG